MKAQFEEVSYEDFCRFLDEYPRKLSGDVCGISEPPLVGYYDFETTQGWGALVAKYHQESIPQNRIYKISRHLI